MQMLGRKRGHNTGRPIEEEFDECVDPSSDDDRVGNRQQRQPGFGCGIFTTEDPPYT